MDIDANARLISLEETVKVQAKTKKTSTRSSVVRVCQRLKQREPFFFFTVSKPDAENPIVKKAKIPKPELKIDSESYQKNSSNLDLIGKFCVDLSSLSFLGRNA